MAEESDVWVAADFLGKAWSVEDFMAYDLKGNEGEPDSSPARFLKRPTASSAASGWGSAVFDRISSATGYGGVGTTTAQLEEFAVHFATSPLKEEEAPEEREQSLLTLRANLIAHNRFLEGYNRNFFFGGTTVSYHESSLTSINNELKIVSSKLHANAPDSSPLVTQDEPQARKVGKFLQLKAVPTLSPFGSKVVRVYDISGKITESPAVNKPDLKVVQADEIFTPGTVFLGMGVPNVYMAHVYGPKDVKVVAAKSLYREATSIVQSKGRVQSGLLFVARNLSSQEIDEIRTLSEKKEGHHNVTCLHENLSILSEAGFSLVGANILEYRLPHIFLQDLLLGLSVKLHNKTVEFDIVKTTSESIDSYYESVKAAVYKTPFRHLDRAFDNQDAKDERKKIAIEISEQNAEKMISLRESKENEDSTPDLGPTFTVRVSETGSLGEFFRSLWGAHVIYKIQLSNQELSFKVDELLPDSLKEFDIPNISFASRVKRDFLFCESVVSMIRSQMACNFQEYEGFTQHNLLSLLPDNTGKGEEEEKVLCNFVLTRHELIVVSNSVYYGLVDWLLTKHVLISGYAHHVKFAGEMWMEQVEGKPKIFINNNSGTYRPTSDQLDKAVQLAKLIFPGVGVVGMPCGPPNSPEKESEEKESEEKESKGKESEETDFEFPLIDPNSPMKMNDEEEVEWLRQSLGIDQLLHKSG